MVVALIVIGVLLLIGLIYILIRNSMVGSRNRVDEAWSGIDVQLKRRHDLVPNLVETVKGYAQGMLSQALGGLRVVAEQYPELRATENFQQLSRNLSELEDEIQASRRIYNSNVQAYNTKIQIFPNSVVAKQGGFTPREFFEIEDAAEREPVAVSFTQPPAAPAQ
jgi:LemA protein